MTKLCASEKSKMADIRKKRGKNFSPTDLFSAKSDHTQQNYAQLKNPRWRTSEKKEKIFLFTHIYF